jgi:YidC/Oxa1 family membrane protein insertase
VIIPLANVLQPLEDAANAVLQFLHDDVGLVYGTAIVGLTFITRALILPLSLKQIHSMRAMSAIQPQVKEMQERYKDDRQRMQREMMRIYQENGVNPFASCLPLILQLPVFLALLNLLRSDTFKNELAKSGQESWLFVNNLAEKATGGALITLLILYAGTSVIAGLIMSGGSANPQQRMIALGLPLLFTPIIIGFPAGVVVYWISTNVWTMGQQAVVRIFWPPPPRPTPEEVRSAKPPPPPPRKKKKRR